MDSIIKNIGGIEFRFDVDSMNTGRGFAHVAELYMGDGERCIGRCRKQYLNRTWESYRFQTAMLGAVRDAIEAARYAVIEQEKARQGWHNLTAARRAVVEALIDENSAVATLNELYNDVHGSRYGTEQERREQETLDVLLAMFEVLFDGYNWETA